MRIVYHYLGIYYLIEEFPNILLSGFTSTGLYKYRKKIRNTAKKIPNSISY